MLDAGIFRKDRGLVLVIVIAAILVMSLITLGTVSRYLSKAAIAESQAAHIQAEILAKGAFWRGYQNGGVPPSDYSEPTPSSTGGIAGSRTYTVTFTSTASAGPSGTTRIDTTVSY